MRRAIRLVPVILLSVSVVAAYGQIIPGDSNTYPSVSVVETPHNLNNFPGVSIPGNQVCLPCHTPHNALLYGDENVLWNHAETGESFVMYKDTAGQPEGPSKMCLSCHDGITAIDNYGGTGGTGIVITGGSKLASDLSNDHPIGIEYPTTPPLSNEYNNPTTFDAGIGGARGVHLVDIGGADRVECTSCHNVHNNGLGNFLLVPLQESYICLQCHIK